MSEGATDDALDEVEEHVETVFLAGYTMAAHYRPSRSEDDAGVDAAWHDYRKRYDPTRWIAARLRSQEGATDDADARYFEESYHDLADAIQDHLTDFIIEDDVAEIAILVEAIHRAGARLRSQAQPEREAIRAAYIEGFGDAESRYTDDFDHERFVAHSEVGWKHSNARRGSQAQEGEFDDLKQLEARLRHPIQTDGGEA